MDLFQVVTTVLSAALGILGILTETRDRDTAILTRWGKANLLLLCMIITVGLLHEIGKSIAASATDYEQNARIRDATIMSNAQMRGITRAVRGAAVATHNIQRSLLSIPPRLDASVIIDIPCEALPAILSADACSGIDESRNSYSLSEPARAAFDTVIGLIHINAVHADNKTFADYAPRPDLLISIDLGDVNAYELIYNEDDATLALRSVIPLEATVQRASHRAESLIDLIGMRVDAAFVGGTCDGRQVPASLEFPCSIFQIRLSTSAGRSFSLRSFEAPTDSRGKYLTEVTEDTILGADDD